jgi:hypothetical protein
LYIVNECAVSVLDEFNLKRVKICSEMFVLLCIYIHIHIVCIHVRRVWRYGRFNRNLSVSQIVLNEKKNEDVILFHPGPQNGLIYI